MAKIIRNCFISYHHKNDQNYLNELRHLKEGMKVADYSLKDDVGYLSDETIYKIVRDKMRSCSVTIVLIGSETGNRKWIDSEIWASLRGYKHPTTSLKSFRPNGLLCIFLPGQNHSIPPRLQDNIDSGYAVSMRWSNVKRDFESKVNYAIWKRDNSFDSIVNSRVRMKSNILKR